ncbi:MAG: hypothetical protein LBN43_07365, partial [Oscillospiraceae bacterium]|nr:hypothetical protein [Oscillospiraceae bacterium]
FISANFKAVAEEGQGGLYGRRTGDDASALMNGSQLLQSAQLNGFDSLMRVNATFSGNPAFKGLPCESKQGNTFQTTLALAMSANCSDKEGAWSFMRGILTSEYQDTEGRGFTGGFPTNLKTFEKQAAEAMTEETEQSIFTMSMNAGAIETGGIDTDDDGIADIYPKGALRSADMLGAKYYYAMTKAEYDRYMGFINSISKVAESDDGILKIISEELKPFFGGQKTAKATAEIIQSRVSIYVNEQR